jgi:putative phosphoesterase
VQIAAICDIHGNFRALTTVWNEIERLGLGAGIVLNGGDNVGYGSDPEETVRFLRSRSNIICVRGNYDKHVAAFTYKSEKYRRRWGKTRVPKLIALEEGSESISEETRSWLAGLPREQEIVVEGIRILLTHYAPGRKEGLGLRTSVAHLEDLAGATTARVVVCGHTHTPFVRSAGGVLFVNPGAVGKSLIGRPTFAVLELTLDRPPAATIRVAEETCRK